MDFKGDFNMLRIIRAGVYNSLYSSKSVQTGKHTLRYYEMELFISASGKTIIDGIEHENRPNNLVFGKVGQSRYSTDSYICYFVHFETDEFVELLDNISSSVHCANPSAIRSCFESLVHIRQNPSEENEFLARRKVYELLYQFYRYSQVASKAEKLKIDHRLISKSIEYIDNNFSKNILLKDIAESIGFSPTYFHKIFTAYTGQTPHLYLLQKRIVAAKHYLLTTDIPISEIAELCGFSSFSYFDYQFKKQVGMTPNKYRNLEESFEA